MFYANMQMLRNKRELFHYLSSLDLSHPSVLEECIEEITLSVYRVMFPYLSGQRDEALQHYYQPFLIEVCNVCEMRDYKRLPHALQEMANAIYHE